MKCLLALCSFLVSAFLTAQWIGAQDSSPFQNVPRASAVEQPLSGTSGNTVMRTNSMSVLDDKKRLGPDDFVSFRVVEDRDNESQRLRVNDNGELEVPYIGLVPAQGKTCRELAYNIKSALEKEYYYHATVILALLKGKDRRRFHLMRFTPSAKR